MKIAVIDVETTGLDPETDRVVEIATTEIAGFDGDPTGWFVGATQKSLVNPHRAIPPEASAVHHLIDEDVSTAPELEEVVERMRLNDFEIIAAHNCRFDMKFFPMLKEKRWIDTYRCAMHIWPDAPNFKNQTLRYWLKLPLLSGRAHEAVSDVVVTARILIRQLAERPAEELMRLSTKACVLKTVGFGKHFGMPWAEVPTDYLYWAVKQQDFDPDVRFTIKNELARRAA